MIFEKVYSKEHFIIEQIYNYFQEEYPTDKRPQLAVRRNPFEENDSGIKYLRHKCPDLIICDHYWERNASKNWSLQGIQGELEWKALLSRADLLLNIPSMSTVDAMMTDTQAGNVCFNENQKYNDEVNYILDSEFSKILMNFGVCNNIYGVHEIEKLLESKSSNNASIIVNSTLSTFAK